MIETRGNNRQNRRDKNKTHTCSNSDGGFGASILLANKRFHRVSADGAAVGSAAADIAATPHPYSHTHTQPRSRMPAVRFREPNGGRLDDEPILVPRILATARLSASASGQHGRAFCVLLGFAGALGSAATWRRAASSGP